MSTTDDAESHRTALLEGIASATDNREGVAVDLRELGSGLGLTAEQTAAAHRWLKSQDLIEDRAVGMQRVCLTASGVRRHEQAARQPDEPTAGMAAVNSTVYNTFTGPVGNVQQGGPGSIQRAVYDTSEPRVAEGTPWWKHFWVQAGAALLAAVLAFFLIRALTSNEESDPSDASASIPSAVDDGDGEEDPFETCAVGRCLPLTITNTHEGGRDVGVYVLSSPYGDGERLSGVFTGTTIYASCIVHDGLEAVPGERRWVRSTFDFVPGDVAADGSFSNPPGSRPSRTSTDHGWITADSVGPQDLVALLPDCEE